jgi:hypothetical protein
MTPTDDTQLIELLATRGMGWELHDVSAHRPGSRALPHVWRWRRAGGVRLMVYDGKSNREWNPLTVEADARELAAELASRGVFATFAPDILTPRAFCNVAAALLAGGDEPVTSPPPDVPQPPAQEAPPDEGV